LPTVADLLATRQTILTCSFSKNSLYVNVLLLRYLPTNFTACFVEATRGVDINCSVNVYIGGKWQLLWTLIDEFAPRPGKFERRIDRMPAAMSTW